MTNYPAHWKTMMLEEVSAVIDPHPSHRAPAIDPKGIPFVGIGDVREDGIADFRGARLVSPKILSEHSERYSLESNLIGLGRVASVGKVVKLPKGDTPYTISPTLAVISPNEISFDFLYYVLQSPQIQNQLIGLKQGSGRQSVGILKLRKVVVPFPPVDEQHKIVGILEDHLSRLDTALADVKQAKLKAAQFRRSLLQAAFTGNLSGDGTRLMTGARSNWKEISLGELGKWITGSTPKSSNPLNFGNDVDFVTPSDIGYGGLLGPAERKISHLGASSVRKVKAPSVILVCIGTIGKVALARRDVTTNQQINSLEVDRSVVDPNFVMWLLSSPEIQEKLWESASSTTVAILNKGNLEKIKTHIPSLPEQRKIVEILEDHLSRLDAAVAIADAMEKQSASLRRSLLQAAFTGELTKEVASV